MRHTHRVVLAVACVGALCRPVNAQGAAGVQRTTPAERAARLTERARQDREIVYFLQPPATHAFDLYHDYTESRAGVDKYLNVVRAGSTVSRPSARVLDTGEELRTEILKGDAIAAAPRACSTRARSCARRSSRATP